MDVCNIVLYLISPAKLAPSLWSRKKKRLAMKLAYAYNLKEMRV